MGDKTPEALTFGFDIGIASVGWCVLGENRIVDLGVRCFDKAETAKEGDPLNLARRTARLMRRRLRRRAWRLVKLARLLKRSGLNCDPRQPSTVSPWKLRVDGLDRRLTDDEWARVIYHLCKHRGFHWISKADKKKAEGDKKEGGRVTQGLSDTERYMAELGTRSVAKMVLTKFPDAQRNKQGNYDKALSRVLLADEMALLFRRQRELGNAHANNELETAILGNGDKKSGLFWQQHPAISGDELLSRVGWCTFERDRRRAPKASFTAERHVWLTRLNNLRIVVDGKTRSLNETERRVALPLPYGYANAKLDYKQLRAALTKKTGLDNFNFAGIAEDKEKDTLVKLPAWETLSKTLKDKGLETEWEGMAGAATGGDPTLLDEIARVLSVFKDGAEVEVELRKLNLPGGENTIEALSEISFDKFHALSLKALRKIVPYMESGLRYDEACQAAGYHHSQLNRADDEKERYLPPFYEHARGHKPGEEGKMIFSERIDNEITGGIPRNHVVLRALNQARKVLNSLIRTYGSPVAVHIEMARDLSRPLKERKAVKDAQEEYRERNEKDRTLFVEQFGRDPKRDELEKFQLYREQRGKSMYPASSDEQSICAYSFAPIDLSRLLEPGYVEIDHVLPYRRSYDNSKNNKVLVLTKENRDKGDRTPYEHLGGPYDNPRWIQFVAFVEGNHYRAAKKSRLLRKNFGEDEAREFRERNLNDTRYICKFFKNYVERYLQFASKVGTDGTAKPTAKRCVVVNGGLTSLLRARWGLPTSKEKREENDRHHAMDAAVVAACGHLVVQRTSTMLNAEGWAHRPDLGGYLNTETGEILTTQEFVRKDDVYKLLPRPWKHFRDELLERLTIDDTTELRTKLETYGTYPPEALDELRPLFVSRAPQRRGGGLLHEATLRSPKRINEGISHVKVRLEDLTMAKLENVVGATHSRNHPLMALLRERLEKHGGDGKKAFAEPVYKPSIAGKGSLVKSVKVATTQNSGMRVGCGVAEWGPMHHVDVYHHSAGFFIAPAYVLDIPMDRQIRPSEPPTDAVFQFSLSKNDYVKIALGSLEYEGYFVMYENDGARITLRAHDQTMPDRKYFRKAVANAKSIRKYHVDVLGYVYPAPPEQRRGLA
jgi:CRISPR-associated endonuclease Csn1